MKMDCKACEELKPQLMVVRILTTKHNAASRFSL